MLFKQSLRLADMLFRHVCQRIPVDRVGIGDALETPLRIPDISRTARHTGAKIIADRAKDEDSPTGHVFAAIRAAAFHDRLCTRIAHSETHAGGPGGEQLAGRRAIQAGISDTGIANGGAPIPGARRDDNRCAGKPLADIVICIA